MKKMMLVIVSLLISAFASSGALAQAAGQAHIVIPFANNCPGVPVDKDANGAVRPCPVKGKPQAGAACRHVGDPISWVSQGNVAFTINFSGTNPTTNCSTTNNHVSCTIAQVPTGGYYYTIGASGCQARDPRIIIY